MKLRRLIKIALMAAILSVLSQISIPVGPVPITLQSLGVFFSGFILGPVDGMLSVIVYILLGSAGVPVFSGGKGGLNVLLGPTGGYLIGFIPSALLCGYFAVKNKGLGQLFAAGLISILLIYSIGVPYLSIIANIPLDRAIKVGALPFIIPDVIKVIIAALPAFRIRKVLLKEGLI